MIKITINIDPKTMNKVCDMSQSLQIAAKSYAISLGRTFIQNALEIERLEANIKFLAQSHSDSDKIIALCRATNDCFYYADKVYRMLSSGCSADEVCYWFFNQGIVIKDDFQVDDIDFKGHFFK